MGNAPGRFDSDLNQIVEMIYSKDCSDNVRTGAMRIFLSRVALKDDNLGILRTRKYVQCRSYRINKNSNNEKRTAVQCIFQGDNRYKYLITAVKA